MAEYIELKDWLACDTVASVCYALGELFECRARICSTIRVEHVRTDEDGIEKGEEASLHRPTSLAEVRANFISLLVIGFKVERYSLLD